jgi:ATP-dependent protease ClpP protease subunit
MQAFASSLLIDDKRTEEILRAHVAMPDDVWALHKLQDVILTAEEAIRYGFARDIRDFAPPKGTQVVNL